jgi:hypothetical protein
MRVDDEMVKLITQESKDIEKKSGIRPSITQVTKLLATKLKPTASATFEIDFRAGKRK